jgi:hypothetical protein
MDPRSSAFRSRWKRHEREVAADLNANRNPNSGGSQADISAPPFAVQHKLHAKSGFPQWFMKASEQARRDAKANEFPLTVHSVALQGQPVKRYAVLDWPDFIRIYHQLKELDRRIADDNAKRGPLRSGRDAS